MKRYISLMFFLAFGLLIVAPHGLMAETKDVQLISNFRFVPADVTINVGDTIRWTNGAGGTHTTTSGNNLTCTPDNLWNASLAPLQTFERVFTEPGVFPYFCAVDSHCQLGMVGTITVNAAATMALPQGQMAFSSAISSVPVLNTDPALANPIGLGTVAMGGDTLDIRIGTVGFSGPADVYFAVFAPQVLGNDIFLFSGGTFMPFASAGLVPWMTGTSGPLDQDLFGAIPVSALPSGSYTLFFAVAPVGSNLVGPFYLWSAAFTIP